MGFILNTILGMGFWDIIGGYPIYIQIPILLLVIFGSILIFAKSIGVWGYLKRFQRKKKSHSKHQLFVEHEYLKHKISMINLTDKKKKDVFKSLLLFKLEAIIHHSKILKEKEITNDNFYQIVVSSMSDIVKEYETTFKKKYGNEIFEFIFNHPEKGFNIIHNRSIVFIKDTVKSMTINNVLIENTNSDKMNLVLDMYRTALLTMTYDINIMYDNFNGDLTKLLNEKT